MRRVLASAALAAAIVLGTASAGAQAHAQLEGTVPADGAVLAASPPEVSFTFGEDLLPGSTTIAVVDAAGTVVTAQPGTIDGPTITAPMPQLAPGTYQVSYRVVSADGHPVTGAITFAVGASAVAETGTTSPAPSSSAASASDTSSGDGGSDGRLLVWAIATILVTGVAFWAIRRRLRR